MSNLERACQEIINDIRPREVLAPGRETSVKVSQHVSFWVANSTSQWARVTTLQTKKKWRLEDRFDDNELDAVATIFAIKMQGIVVSQNSLDVCTTTNFASQPWVSGPPSRTNTCQNDFRIVLSRNSVFEEIDSETVKFWRQTRARCKTTLFSWDRCETGF